MPKVIHAIFKDGVFKPLEKINLPENQRVDIVIEDDIPTRLIAIIAEEGDSFQFLSNPKEDVYSIKDGEPI